MIEHDYVRARPGMQLACNLQLLGLRQDFVEWNDLTVVIERCERLQLTGADVDDSIRVHRDIRAENIESAAGCHGLRSRQDHTVLVLDLESFLYWKRLPFPNVSDPHDRARNSISVSLH